MNKDRPIVKRARSLSLFLFSRQYLLPVCLSDKKLGSLHAIYLYNAGCTKLIAQCVYCCCCCCCSPLYPIARYCRLLFQASNSWLLAKVWRRPDSRRARARLLFDEVGWKTGVPSSSTLSSFFLTGKHWLIQVEPTSHGSFSYFSLRTDGTLLYNTYYIPAALFLCV